jgi:hypothetical protein
VALGFELNFPLGSLLYSLCSQLLVEMGSHKLFDQAGLEPRSFLISISQVASVAGVNYHIWLNILRQHFAKLPRLASNSWAQGIPPPQPPSSWEHRHVCTFLFSHSHSMEHTWFPGE